MIESRQRRVLYREFLFRVADRELLSAYSSGDASRLLLQVVTLLFCGGALLSIPALFIGRLPQPQAELQFSWSVQHFLIATTMLAVGVATVLAWDAVYPDQRDVLVLSPLPVRARTIMTAKTAATMTMLGVVVLALHAVNSVAWSVRLTGTSGLLRMFIAYWLTMVAAALFVFGAAAGVQGTAAALLPHRLFQRVSPLLQLMIFVAVVGGFFLQPMAVTPAALDAAQRGWWPLSSPSLWFLGLLQSLSGSPIMARLAGYAIAALAATLALAMVALRLAYIQTLRRLAEEPDLAPTVQGARRLLRLGGPLSTAIAHFTARTLFRSAPHRVLFTFYLGIGTAISAVLLKTPRAIDADSSLPLIVSSLVMMACAVIGARLTFAIPRDISANWIFRMLPVPGGTRFVAARRRTFVTLAAGPVWLVSAAVFLTTWPWHEAVGHLTILALVGATLVELSLLGTQRIPFTCSYLPGRSHAHITVPLGLMLLLVLTLVGAGVEREALRDARRFIALVTLLALVWAAARWRTWLLRGSARPEFEDEPADRLVTVELWDVRR